MKVTQQNIERFLTMLDNNQILSIKCDKKVKFIGANAFSRWDFTYLVAWALGLQDANDNKIHNSFYWDDPVNAISECLKNLIEECYTTISFKDDYARYAYCDTHLFKFYM